MNNLLKSVLNRLQPAIDFARRRRIVAGILGVGFILLIGSFLLGGGENDLRATHRVEESDFLVTIVEGGTLEAVNEITVRNEVDGNSRIIYIIPEGTYVQKGDLVVELDGADAEDRLNAQEISYSKAEANYVRAENELVITRSEAESNVRQAELSMRFAEMDLEKFLEIEREQEIRNAQIAIITAQESLKIAEDRLEWSEKLTDEGFETKSNLDRDKLSVTNQSLGLEKARNVERMLTQYDLEK